jgi:hypothetical protein
MLRQEIAASDQSFRRIPADRATGNGLKETSRNRRESGRCPFESGRLTMSSAS